MNQVSFYFKLQLDSKRNLINGLNPFMNQVSFYDNYREFVQLMGRES